MTQNDALAILKSGRNVFLTGEPGSGKTHAVNLFVAWLKENSVRPAITASTGIAATHIGGYTLHSWSGIGVRSVLTSADLDRIMKNKRVIGRMRGASVLIIDEISMLSAPVFEMAEVVCCRVRGSSAPFGGMQVVLVGDFFQLPPIAPREAQDDPESLFGARTRSGEDLFAFASPLWNTLNLVSCYLSEQYRQEDAAFLEVLSAVRRGEVSPIHRALLESRFSASQKPEQIITQLFSHNADVDRVNKEELKNLIGKELIFEMTNRGSKALVAEIKRGCLSPETLAVKIGARVMFTKNNFDEGFVNGTTGVISGFSKESGYPIVEVRNGERIIAEPMDWSIEEGGRVLALVRQVPLRLAWAITIHKSQGMSLDAAHIDLSSAFEYGQGYVALSRVRTLAGLSLAGLNDRALEVHPRIREFDAKLRSLSRAAQEEFSNFNGSDLARLHRDFVSRCTGRGF